MNKKHLPFSKMNADNTAFLIIDVINSSAHEACEIPEWGIRFSKIRAMVPRLNRFVQEYRGKIGGLLIFGTTVPWRKEYVGENVNELYEDKRFVYYSKDASGFPEQFYGIQPQESDIIVDKKNNDAFSNPKLVKKLEEKGIKYIIVAGAFTDACVLASVVGGFSRGYNMVVLQDLVETTDMQKRQNIQKELLEFTFPYLFARVIFSGELLEGWGNSLTAR